MAQAECNRPAPTGSGVSARDPAGWRRKMAARLTPMIFRSESKNSRSNDCALRVCSKIGE